MDPETTQINLEKMKAKALREIKKIPSEEEGDKERSKSNKKEKKHKKKKNKSRSRSRKRSRSKSRSSKRNRHSSTESRYNFSDISRSKKKKSKKQKKSRERSIDRSKERPKRKSTSPRDKRSRNNESISKETNNNSNFQLKDDSKISKIVNKNPDIPISHSDPAKIKRELYITNFPEGLIPSQVTELMNTAMVAINANIKSGNPIVSTWINPESNYAILEFRTEEEANNAFKLDGISILGKSIKIGRPQNPGEENIHQQIKDMFPTLTSFEKDLNNPYLNRSIVNGTALSSSSSFLALPSTQTVLPTCSKLLVSNLPLNFDQNAVYKFLKSFGKIKTLEIIRDPITGQYSGQCHVEFEKESDTVRALHCNNIINKLDIMGINLQGNILYIKRSSGLVPTYNFSSSKSKSNTLGVLGNNNQQYMTAEDYNRMRESNPSNVICCKNMVTMKELEDDEEYDEIYDDVWEECQNYGKVISIKIPRPEGKGVIVPGIGKVFVEFATKDGASFARDHLNGKSFRQRFVDVVFHPEDMFKKGQYD